MEHRAAFKAETTKPGPVIDGCECSNLVQKLQVTHLNAVPSNKVQMSHGLPQGAPESLVIFTMIMELVLRDLVKSWKVRNLAWSVADFLLTAICHADDWVLAAASVAATDVVVADVIAKLKEVGLTVGTEKTHWTSHPKMVDAASWCWDRICVWIEMRGTRLCTDMLKRTRAWRNGEADWVHRGSRGNCA